jgi:hypothetical protein
MKTTMLLIASAALVLAGCTTYRGGTADEYYYYPEHGSGLDWKPAPHQGTLLRDLRDPNIFVTPEATPPYVVHP